MKQCITNIKPGEKFDKSEFECKLIYHEYNTCILISAVIHESCATGTSPVCPSSLFSPDSSPCIDEDGTVYIGSQSEAGGYIHAFGPVESNSPPETSTISGETNGEAGVGYWYTFVAVDPDNNPVTFYIDWGDGVKDGK